MSLSSSSPGFSLIEVIIAMLVLTVGLLAMAASTGYVATQIRAANLRGERAFAVEYVMEDMRAASFDQLASRSEGDAKEVGSFKLWWEVQSPTTNLRRVNVISEGPGFRQNVGWVRDARDTISFSVVRPFR